MTVRRLLGAALSVPMIIGGLLLVTAGPAVACSCARLRSEVERAARADAVFVGTLVSQVNRIDRGAERAVQEARRTSNSAVLIQALRSDSSRVVWTFEVSLVYKGAVGNRQEIVTPPGGPDNCGGFGLRGTEPFLVFAHKPSHELSRQYQLDPGQYL